MNVALRKSMSLEEFLAWEERQELRYEFDGFQPIAMTGGTFAHSSLQVDLLTALANHLRGKPCRPQGSHMKLMLGGRIRYPDAFVVCSPVSPAAKVITDPVVVFEILSDSSVGEDLVTKNAEYRAARSIQRYVVLPQTQIGATVFSRQGDLWVTELADGADAVLRLPEIEVEFPLSEIYQDVGLTGAEEDRG